MEGVKALLEAVRLFGNYTAVALKSHRTANCLLSEKSMTGSLIMQISPGNVEESPILQHGRPLVSYPLCLDQRTLNSCTAGEEDTTHHFSSLTLKYGAACVIALISISFISLQDEAT